MPDYVAFLNFNNIKILTECDQKNLLIFSRIFRIKVPGFHKIGKFDDKLSWFSGKAEKHEG